MTHSQKKKAKLTGRSIDQRIGELVMKGRKAKKINQVELSIKVGLDQSAFSRMENGKQQLTASQWILLHKLEVLQVDAVERVLYPERYPDPEPGKEKDA